MKAVAASPRKLLQKSATENCRAELVHEPLEVLTDESQDGEGEEGPGDEEEGPVRLDVLLHPELLPLQRGHLERKGHFFLEGHSPFGALPSGGTECSTSETRLPLAVRCGHR